MMSAVITKKKEGKYRDFETAHSYKGIEIIVFII